MENTIEIIKDVFDTYSHHNPDKINKIYSFCSRETILNLVTWLGELKDFNYKEYESYIKQKYINDTQNKLSQNKNEYENIIKSKDAIIEQQKNDFYKMIQSKDKIIEQQKSEFYNKLSQENQLKQNELDKQFDRFEIQKYKDLERKDKELDRMVQVNKQLTDIIDNKLTMSNSSKGDQGENYVFDTLSNYNNYDDLEIIKVAKEKGSGDLIAISKKYDINIMIEVKNSLGPTPKPQLQVFKDHYTEYFLSHNKSHAIIFSLNYHKFIEKGSYKIESVIINDNTHYIMYLASKNMTEEFITEHFNIFIDYIKLNSKKTEYNNINILKQLEETNKILQLNIDEWALQKKKYFLEIDNINNNIQNTITLMESNKKQMDHHNFFPNSTHYEIYKDVINKLHQKNVDLNTFDSFTSSYKSAGFKNKTMLIELNSSFQKIAKRKSIKEIYDILIKYNK